MTFSKTCSFVVSRLGVGATGYVYWHEAWGRFTWTGVSCLIISLIRLLDQCLSLLSSLVVVTLVCTCIKSKCHPCRRRRISGLNYRKNTWNLCQQTKHNRKKSKVAWRSWEIRWSKLYSERLYKHEVILLTSYFLNLADKLCLLHLECPVAGGNLYSANL